MATLSAKIGGFPTDAKFTRMVAEGIEYVKDSRNGRNVCIKLRSDGRHCGEFLILQGNNGGWDLGSSSLADTFWRCPKKHDPLPEATVGANPKILSVEERQALMAVASRVQDPETGVLISAGITSAIENAPVKETVVETTVTKDKILFDVNLDELTSTDLVNQLLSKISDALDRVPTSNMGEAKKLMKIQEVVESLKKSKKTKPEIV